MVDASLFSVDFHASAHVSLYPRANRHWNCPTLGRRGTRGPTQHPHIRHLHETVLWTTKYNKRWGSDVLSQWWAVSGIAKQFYNNNLTHQQNGPSPCACAEIRRSRKPSLPKEWPWPASSWPKCPKWPTLERHSSVQLLERVVWKEGWGWHRTPSALCEGYQEKGKSITDAKRT